MAIIVKNYVVDTYEDDFKLGEIGRTCACWTNSEVPVRGTFRTAREALGAIAEANYWTSDKLKWNDRREYGDPIGTYETSVEVDADNAEADAKRNLHAVLANYAAYVTNIGRVECYPPHTFHDGCARSMVYVADGYLTAEVFPLVLADE